MTRRIDATLNDERIVAAARQLLTDEPEAGMERVAAAAGVGRATLYRRFATRDELLDALRAEARREAIHAIKTARPTEGTAEEALERMIRSLLVVADRFAFASTAAHKHEPDPKLVKPWLALIRRGQETGEFSRDLEAEGWLDVIRAHFRAAHARVTAGESLEEVARRTTHALLSGLGTD